MTQAQLILKKYRELRRRWNYAPIIARVCAYHLANLTAPNFEYWRWTGGSKAWHEKYG